MKQNDITDINNSLTPQHYENIFNVYEDKDVGYYFNLLRNMYFPVDLNPSAYNVYTTMPGDTPPAISWKVYNSVYLWWSICSVNNINNPLEDIKPGTQLKILKPVILQNILNQIQNI